MDVTPIIDRLDELSALLSQPDLPSTPEKLAEVMKEYRKLEPIGELCRQYTENGKDLAEAEQILSAESDEDLLSMAREEKEELLTKQKQLEEEIDRAMHPDSVGDDVSFAVEIRGGAGGEEAALFAASVYRMYTMYAAKNGWKIDVVSLNETELGGCKEISFLVEGEGAYRHFKYESGVHRVQRVPETESGGRIHTSTVTVAVLPETDDVEVDIRPEDLSIDTFRSSGAGGQHINKTESAIRITHKPSGLVVECQDERSQYKNKDKAMRVLRSRLLDMERQKQQSAVADNRRSQVGTGDRSERIRTYNFPQSRVTDHRIGLTVYKLDAVMNGDVGLLVEELIREENGENFPK